MSNGLVGQFTPEARAAIERIAYLPTNAPRAEIEAYAELSLLAGRWRKRRFIEREALQSEEALPFTKATR